MTGVQPTTRAARVLADLLRAMGDTPPLTDQEKRELRRRVRGRLKGTT